MSDILIYATSVIQADGVVQADSIFEQINSLAGSAGETAKTLFGAGFLVGAAVTWIKNKFSVSSGIVGIILAAVGLAILSQLDVVKQSFEDTVTSSPTVNEAPAFEAQTQLDDPIVITVYDELEAA